MDERRRAVSGNHVATGKSRCEDDGGPEASLSRGPREMPRAVHKSATHTVRSPEGRAEESTQRKQATGCTRTE